MRIICIVGFDDFYFSSKYREKDSRSRNSRDVFYDFSEQWTHGIPSENAHY